jgi:hypothetical protein
MRFPVSFSQQRLWFLDQLAPGEPTYNMPYAVWLDGPLDVQALQRALDVMVARHAVFRTSIVSFDGVPEQVVADACELPIEHIEIAQDLAGDEAVKQAEAIAAEVAHKPFDLADGPLFRPALIAAGPDRHMFLLTMHHSMSDGESMKVLLTELAAAYRAETTGVPATFPELWVEYGDYAVWQHDRVRGEELQRQLAYWRDALRGAPQVLSLPTDRPRPARQTTRGGATAVFVDVETTRRLAEVTHSANATMFMVFLTGFTAVLSRFARQSDFMIGTQVAGRTHAELDPLVGMFANTIALRMSLAGDPTFRELLGKVRDTVVDGLAHQELPWEKLVEEFAPGRTLAHAPMVQVQFVYGSLTAPQLEFRGLTTRQKALLTGTAKLDLTMYADAWEGGSTILSLEYSADLFDPPWAERFLNGMLRLLTHAADAPDTPVADLRILSDAEQQALTVGRNHPQAQAAHEAGPDIRTQLQASASTVIDAEGSLPMSQVCDRAARIARTLADRGAGPETTVGLCMRRGIDMLAALLGVWWAGGAYVPLDPAFPAGCGSSFPTPPITFLPNRWPATPT